MATIPAFMQSQSCARPDPRKWSRFRVSLPAVVATKRGRRAVRLRDLCRGGALVEAPVPLQLGSEVSLNCGPIEAEGLVVWQRAQRCGIWFYEPLDEAVIEGVLAGADPVPDRRAAGSASTGGWTQRGRRSGDFAH